MKKQKTIKSIKKKLRNQRFFNGFMAGILLMIIISACTRQQPYSYDIAHYQAFDSFVEYCQNFPKKCDLFTKDIPNSTDTIKVN